MVENNSEKHSVYEYAVDLSAGTAAARVVRMVGKQKKVLEIGAGPGSITRHLRYVNDCKIVGLELDTESIKKLAPFCDRVYQGDLNDPSWPKLLQDEGQFDVVVAADVLEHLYDSHIVLRQMAEFMNDTGCVIVSLPHVGHSAIHACLMEEDFEYRDCGLLDRTHIRFFGIKNIQKLFDDAGLKIIHAEFVLRKPENTEFSARWAKTSFTLRRALLANKFGLVYQVVVKAVPINAQGKAISLMDLPAVLDKVSVTNWLKSHYWKLHDKLH